MRLALLAAASGFLAQATPGVPDEVGRWLNLGTAGLVIIGWLSGKIRRGQDYDQVAAENARLRQVFEERVLPALIEATKMQAQVGDLLTRMVEQRRL